MDYLEDSAVTLNKSYLQARIDELQQQLCQQDSQTQTYSNLIRSTIEINKKLLTGLLAATKEESHERPSTF